MERLHLIFLELFVSEGVTLFTWFNFVKTVHVELADEWGKVAVLKMFGKNLSGESVDIFDNKAVSIFAPGNDVLIVGVLSQGKGTSTIL